MRKKSRRIWSWLLVLVMVLSMQSAPVFAAEPGNDQAVTDSQDADKSAAADAVDASGDAADISDEQKEDAGAAVTEDNDAAAGIDEDAAAEAAKADGDASENDDAGVSVTSAEGEDEIAVYAGTYTVYQKDSVVGKTGEDNKMNAQYDASTGKLTWDCDTTGSVQLIKKDGSTASYTGFTRFYCEAYISDASSSTGVQSSEMISFTGGDLNVGGSYNKTYCSSSTTNPYILIKDWLKNAGDKNGTLWIRVAPCHPGSQLDADNCYFWINAGSVSALKQSEYTVDLGTLSTGVKASGSLSQKVTAGQAISNIVLKADTAYVDLTQAQANTVNAALAGTGLSASYDAANKTITISGTATGNVSKNLSTILPALTKAQATDSAGNRYASVSDALGSVSTGTITATGAGLTPVSGGTLKNGVTLKTDKGAYKAAGDAVIDMDAVGNITLKSGKLDATGETAVKAVLSDGTTVEVKVPAGKTYTIDTKAGTVSGIGKAAAVTIDGISYVSGTENGSFPLDSRNGRLANNGDKATVPAGKDANLILGGGTTPVVKVSAGNTGDTTVTKENPSKVTLGKAGDTFAVGGKTYTAAEDGTEFSVGEDGQVGLTKGAATLDKNDEVVVGNSKTPVKNTGDEKITVKAKNDGTGTVDVPKGGAVDIKNAKIAASDAAKTIEIGADGRIKVSVPVTVGDITYTGEDGATLTVDPETGKVIGSEGNVTKNISEDKLKDPNFSYELEPGESITIGKYVYTAPEDGNAVTIKGRGVDANGNALTPAVTLKDQNDKVDVALKDDPVKKTTYTADNANTKFVMSADDTDTTKIDLLDNGSKDANSQMKASNGTTVTGGKNTITASGDNAVIGLDENGNAMLVSGKGTVTGEAAVKVKTKDSNGNPKTVEITVPAGKTCTIDADKGEVTGIAKDATVNVDGITYTSGEDNGSFPLDPQDVKLTKDGDQAAVPAGKEGSFILGEGATPVVKVPNTNAGTTTVAKNDPSKVKLGKTGDTFTVGDKAYTAPFDDAEFTVDADGNVTLVISEDMLKDPSFSYELEPGQSVTVGNYVYTAPADGSKGDVTIKGRVDADGKIRNPEVTLKNADGKVNVALKNDAATKTTYTADNANTKFAMSANDTDTTKIDLLDNGSKDANSQMKAPKGTTVTGGKNAITAASDNAVIGLDENGNAMLVSGKGTVTGEAAVKVKTKDSNGNPKAVEVTVPDGKTYTIDADNGEVTGIDKDATVTVDGITYTSGEDNGSFPLDNENGRLANDGDQAAIPAGKDAGLVLGEGTTPVVKVPGTNTGDTIVTKDAPSKVTLGKAGDTFAVGDKTYTAASDDAEFTLDEDGKVTLAKGAAALDKDEEVNVVAGTGSVPVKNTGDEKITVSAKEDGTGIVDVPKGGAVDIKNAKITVPDEARTITIGADGLLTVNVPVTVDGITYTGDPDVTLTVDPETGKVTGVNGGSVNLIIPEEKLKDKDFSYELEPGQSVTIGKYVYTAPADGSKGDVTIQGRGVDSKGSALTPEVVLKNKDGKVDVALKDDAATKTTYTADNANTRFAMSADDVDTTKIDLLDNGSTDANSRIKAPNGVTVTGGKNQITAVGDQTVIGLDENKDAMLSGGKGQVTGAATVKVAIKNGNGSTKQAEVTVPDGKTYVLDADKAEVTGLNKNDSVTVDGVTFTASKDGSSFPLDSQNGRLKNDGDKATVGAGKAAGVILGEGTTPVVKVPAGNTGETIIVKGNPSKVTLGKSGDKFTVGGKTYTAASDGAEFTIDADGNVRLVKGSAKLMDGDSIIAGNGRLITNPADSGNDEIIVTANSPEDGKDTIKVPANGKVQIGYAIYEASPEGVTIIAGEKEDGVLAGSLKKDGGSSKHAEENAARKNANSPKTGDNSNILVWIVCMILSIAAISGVIVVRRKKKYNR